MTDSSKRVEIPESVDLRETPWGPFNISGVDRLAILSDIHLPYHDPPAVKAAIAEAKRRNCDGILINGDLLDFARISRFQPEMRARSTSAESKAGKAFLKYLRQEFPKARIFYKLGNHDERWDNYFLRNAPEMAEILAGSLGRELEVKKLRIRMIGEKRPIRYRGLFILHGHEYRFAITNPVNPARGLFLRAKAKATCGHFHQRSEHQERTLNGSNITTWSSGCLCHLNPPYMPQNNWSHGAQFVEGGRGDDFYMHNKAIIDGKVY